MSLRHRLVGMVTGLTLLLMLFVIIIVDRQFEAALSESLDRRMNTIGYTVGTMVLPSLVMSGGTFENQLAIVQKILEKEVRDQEDVEQIVIMDRRQKRVVAFPEEAPVISTSNRRQKLVPIQLRIDGLVYGYVDVTFNIASYNEQERQVSLNLLLIGLAFSFIGFLASLYVAKSITSPIEHLAEGAMEFGHGNFDARVKVENRNEVGRLAGTFNEMADKIERQIRRVNLLQRCTRQIAGELERENVLDASVDAFVQVANVTKMSIMLLDDAGNELKIERGIGLAEGAKNFVKFRRGEGIAGRVLDSGKALYVPELSESPYFQSFSGDKKHYGQLLAIPLVVKSRCFGVVNLHEKSDGSAFDNSDRSILTTLAEVMAVAIDNARLYDMAITDGLTKLYIARHFHQRLSEEITRTHRTAAQLGLLMTDIDHFKKVNDTYGHQTGDTVLSEMAGVMRRIFREVDIPCRYGGEEFAVILPNTDKAGGMIVAERFRKAVEAFEFTGPGGTKLSMTVSCGVSTYKQGISKNDFVHEADTALYKSKREGRNRSRHFDDLG